MRLAHPHGAARDLAGVATHPSGELDRLLNDAVDIAEHAVDELVCVFEDVANEMRDGKSLALRVLLQHVVELTRHAGLNQVVLALIGGLAGAASSRAAHAPCPSN